MSDDQFKQHLEKIHQQMAVLYNYIGKLLPQQGEATEVWQKIASDLEKLQLVYDQMQSLNQEVQAQISTPVTSLPPSLDGLQVLIVDDEADAREFISTVLESQGIRPLAVPSAAAALEALETFHPDVLLCDIRMRGQDGYALIRQVRELEAKRGWRLPAAALTAYLEETPEKSLAAGFEAHFNKLAQPAELVEVVTRLAGRTLVESSEESIRIRTRQGEPAEKVISPTILLVVWDNETRRVLWDNLRCQGYRVIVTLDEEDAFGHPDDGRVRPDLILLHQSGQSVEEDINIGCCIRQHRRLSRCVPIVVVAERYGTDLEGQDVRVGENAYVTYLEDGQQLLNLLERLCRDRPNGRGQS